MLGNKRDVSFLDPRNPLVIPNGSVFGKILPPKLGTVPDAWQKMILNLIQQPGNQIKDWGDWDIEVQ